MGLKKEFAIYVALNLLSMVGLSLYIFADTFFVSNGIGSSGLAALNIAIPAFSLVNGVGLLIGIGASTHYSICRGRGMAGDGNCFFTYAAVFAGGFSVLFLCIGLWGAVPAAHLLGADGELLPYVVPYIRTIFLFSPAFLFNNLLIAFVRNDQSPQLSMAAMLAGSFSNIILDYIFIFPLQLGMLGAAVATGLAPVISLCVLSVHFVGRKQGFSLTRCRFALSVCRDSITAGAPAFITELSNGFIILLFNCVILRLSGNIGVAAYGVIANIALIAVSVFNGIAQGVQPLFSRYFGMQDCAAVKSLLNSALCMAIGVGAALYLGAALFSYELVGIFNMEQNAQLAALAVSGVYLYFIAFFFMGINLVCASYCAAVKRERPAFILSALRGFAAVIPLLFLLSALWGMTGVWLVIPAAELVTLLAALPLLRYVR